MTEATKDKGHNFMDLTIKLFEKGNLKLTIKTFKEQVWLNIWELNTDKDSDTYNWWWTKGDIPIKIEELGNLIFRLEQVESFIDGPKYDDEGGCN